MGQNMIIPSYLLITNQLYFNSGFFINVCIVEKEAEEEETPLIAPIFNFSENKVNHVQ